MDARVRDRLARAACEASGRFLDEHYHRRGQDMTWGKWDDPRVPEYQRELYRTIVDAVVAEMDQVHRGT